MIVKIFFFSPMIVYARVGSLAKHKPMLLFSTAASWVVDPLVSNPAPLPVLVSGNIILQRIICWRESPVATQFVEYCRYRPDTYTAVIGGLTSS